MSTQSKSGKVFQIGEVYMMNFSGTGSEQTGWRPGLIFQNNIGNIHSPNVIALPLTSSMKKVDQPTHVVIQTQDSGLHVDSMVLCENPERMSKSNIGQYITKLSDTYMQKIAVASLLATSAVSFLETETLIAVRDRAIALNSVVM